MQTSPERRLSTPSGQRVPRVSQADHRAKLDRSQSRPPLLVSVVALVLEQGYYVLVSGAPIVKPLAFTVIGIGLVWLAHHGIKRGWLL